MIIKTQPGKLAEQISLVQKAISTRTNMKILECIHFKTQGQELVLTATDLELTIISSMDVEVVEEGEMVLPANMAGNIFRKLPAQEATVTNQDNRVLIECGGSRFELQVPNPREFPDIPDFEPSQTTVLDNSVLIQAIHETEFAASSDESKLVLTGIFYERKEDYVRLVTLDGYRLAIRQVNLPEEAGKFEEETIVSKRAFSEWAKIIDPGEKTSICLVSDHIYFQSGRLKLYSNLIDKSFIKYEEILTMDYSTRVVIDRKAFQQALERASLLTREERANLIKLDFDGQCLHISSNSEIGQVDEKVPIQQEGKEIKIAFNAKYLLDGVRTLTCDGLSIELNGSLNPLVMRPSEKEEDYLYLVLPVRVAGSGS